MARLVLELRFGPKLPLPLNAEVRHCLPDNFLFVAGGRQMDYDEYYANNVNDSFHREVAEGQVRSPISKLQCRHLVTALDGFFDRPRKVLDFGCGGASLLLELASRFPSSTFFGFEPGPAAATASTHAKLLGLSNLTVSDLGAVVARGPYDLVVVSHVIEHVLNFDLFTLLNSLVGNTDLLYVEVPNALAYPAHPRREFLYYFDRLHVNHFTPQSLARLAGRYGFGVVSHFEYAFPYRDDGYYPALGMVLRKGSDAPDLLSPSLLDSTQQYLSAERLRSEEIARELAQFEGLLIWGAGDNFYRSAGSDGPLCGLRNVALLDRRCTQVSFGDRSYQTLEPGNGLRAFGWPVVVTVSEGRNEIARQVAEIDPTRKIFFI